MSLRFLFGIYDSELEGFLSNFLVSKSFIIHAALMGSRLFEY